MEAIVLPKGSLLRIGAVDLTEHNRSEVSIVPEQIKNDKRTIDGTMRRQHITFKRRLSVAWTDLPSLDTKTVDGKTGGKSLLQLYMNNPGDFDVTVRDNQGILTTYRMFFDSFDYAIKKRWQIEFWDVSLELVEL